MPHGAVAYPFGNCLICKDQATGVHYGAATCEGCKGFFKRNLPKGDKYRCFFGGQCQLSPANRNRCKACRFARCLAVGMSVDAVRMGRIPKVDKERALEMVRRGEHPPAKRNQPDPDLGTKVTSHGAVLHALGPSEQLIAAHGRPMMERSSGPLDHALMPQGSTPWMGSSRLPAPYPPHGLMNPAGLGLPSSALQPDRNMIGLGQLGLSYPTSTISAHPPGRSAVIPSSAVPNSDWTALVPSDPNSPTNTRGAPYCTQPPSIITTTHMKPSSNPANIPIPLVPSCHGPIIPPPHKPTAMAPSDTMTHRAAYNIDIQTPARSFTPHNNVSIMATYPDPPGACHPNEVPAVEDAGFAAETATDTRSFSSRSHDGFSRHVIKDLITQVVQTCGMDGLQYSLKMALMKVSDDHLQGVKPIDIHCLNDVIIHMESLGEKDNSWSLPDCNDEQAKDLQMERFLQDTLSQQAAGDEKSVMINEGNESLGHTFTNGCATTHVTPSAINKGTVSRTLANQKGEPPNTEDLGDALCLERPITNQVETESHMFSDDCDGHFSLSALNNCIVTRRLENQKSEPLNMENLGDVELMDSSDDATFENNENMELVRNTVHNLQIGVRSFSPRLREQMAMMEEEMAGIYPAHPLNQVKRITKNQQYYFWQQIFASIPQCNDQILGFCLGIPGFKSLSEEGRKMRLLESYFSMWMLQLNPLYRDRDSYLYMIGTPRLRYSSWWMTMFLSKEKVDVLHDFQDDLRKWEPSHLELGVLCAISFWSIDIGEKSRDHKMIQLLRSHYIEVLEYVVRTFRKSNQEECLSSFKQLNQRAQVVAKTLSSAVHNFVPTEPPYCLTEDVFVSVPEPETAGDDKPWNQSPRFDISS